MIINVLANGDIKNIVPENIYQGSNKANTIVLLAPFSASVTPTISFELPQTHEIKGGATGYLFNEPTEVSSTLNMWTLQVDEVLTQYYGDVKYQIKFVNTDNEVVAVARGKFKVNEGIDFELPATPSQDVYELLLQNISNIRADFLNGWIEAHGIREYNSEFAYGLGSYVFGVVDNKTMFFKSLIENNKGNALTNTSAWKSIIIGINGVKVNGVEQPTDIDGNIELTVPTKLSELTDDVGIPSKLSELQDDVGYAKTGDENTFWANQKFYRGIHIRVGTGYPFVDIGNSKVTPSGQDYTVATIRHTAINQQNNQTKESSLYLPTRSGTIALTKDIQEATTPEALLEKIEDSETIVHTLSNDKLKFELDAEVQNKIEKSLVTPMSTPSATELVAVDSTNSQTMIEIGAGLSLENGTLKATGGGGGGDFVETDPTVPAWAKKPTKPTYTASEVGAVASTNGTASNLNVTNFTITGALISGVSNGIWVSSDGQNFRMQNPNTFISVNKIEKNTNKTTTISNASTDAQYPSAKAVYDYVQSATQNAIQDTWEASY